MATLPTIPAGADYAVTVTITKDGAAYNTTGHTLTVTVLDGDYPYTKLVDGAAVTNNGGTSNNATISLAAGTTAGLRTHTDVTRAVNHYADVKVVESGGAVVFTERFTVPVRRTPSAV